MTKNILVYGTESETVKNLISIIVISAEKSECVKIQSFQAGADDYIQTDCCLLELINHIGQLLIDDRDKK